MGGEELVDRVFGPGSAGGQDDRDVGVARGPDIFEQATGRAFAQRGDGIAQPVQGSTQGCAPTLVPSLASAVAAAVGTPALDAVSTAPGSIIDDFCFPSGRELGSELPVIDQPG